MTPAEQHLVEAVKALYVFLASSGDQNPERRKKFLIELRTAIEAYQQEPPTKLEQRATRMEKAIKEEIDFLTKYTEGSTHFEGCEKSHRPCAALKRLRDAIKEPT